MALFDSGSAETQQKHYIKNREKVKNFFQNF